MRSNTSEQAEILSSLTPDQLVPADHPIRRIKLIVDRALTELNADFAAMYSRIGRPSIAPEWLLTASLLIALYTVRSERQFYERLRYDMLFKWFLNMNIGDPAFDPTTFSKNRERLLDHEVARRFFNAVRAEAERRELVSDDHFTVDGTLLGAWASVKSIRPKTMTAHHPRADAIRRWPFTASGGATTPISRPPTRRLVWPRRAMAPRPGPVTLMENRNGLVVDAALTQADGYAERATALRFLQHRRSERPTSRHWTVGGDKGYNTKDFAAGCRAVRVTPHVTQHTTGRRSAIDERTTHHSGYPLSQKVRKRVEEVFGWKRRWVGVASCATSGSDATRCGCCSR